MRSVAFVTGGSRGIGEAICETLAGGGVHVAVAARTAADVERVAAAIRLRGGAAMPAICDVTRPDSIAAAVDAVRREFGPITILVNNAGATGSDNFSRHDDALWHRMIDVNLNSVYYTTKAVVPTMTEAKWGRIINMASIGARTGAKYLAAYVAAKHGVLGLTRSLATELVGHNITVNAICPTHVDTPMTAAHVAEIVARTGVSPADARASLERANPQNRLITPREVAALVAMLVSDDARGINGQAINLDGGWLMS